MRTILLLAAYAVCLTQAQDAARVTLDTAPATPNTTPVVPNIASVDPETAAVAQDKAPVSPYTASTTLYPAPVATNTSIVTPDEAPVIPGIASVTLNAANVAVDTASAASNTSIVTPDKAPFTPDRASITLNTAPVAPNSAPVTPGTAFVIPGLVFVNPGITFITPGTAPGIPGTAPGIPGTAPATPGTAPATPGTAPDTPGTAPLTADVAPVPLDTAPVARTNWAVARAGDQVYTFYGLGPNKTHADIQRDVHALNLTSGKWRKVGDIPVERGRLAASAVTVAGVVYLIGGYTVSPTGGEISRLEVFRFHPDNGSFEVETNMPLPVDDSVALNWRDRWIILVSGWSNFDNVDHVQIYDTQTRQWTSATPYPGKPVFGHAGGLTGDTMVVCDGVKRDSGFKIANECWKGVLDAQQPSNISWSQLPVHPGIPLYRAGAIGDAGRILFAGGSDNPYNYDGVGYNGSPSEPSTAVLSFDPALDAWQAHSPLPEAGMDYRGLVPMLGEGVYGLFGGMRAEQRVSGGVITFKIPAEN